MCPFKEKNQLLKIYSCFNLKTMDGERENIHLNHETSKEKRNILILFYIYLYYTV
jgi:hypothetical protein